MYKRHTFALLICFTGIFFFTFKFSYDFGTIAPFALTVSSIIMGVYIATVSALLGSNYAKRLGSVNDKEITGNTLLGVLGNYFDAAGKCCIMLIVLSCLFLIPLQTYNTVTHSRHYLILIFSSLSYAIFAINIVFLYLILIFLVNSLRKSIECNIDD